MAFESLVDTGARESPCGSEGIERSTFTGGGSIESELACGAAAGDAPIDVVTGRLDPDWAAGSPPKVGPFELGGTDAVFRAGAESTGAS